MDLAVFRDLAVLALPAAYLAWVGLRTERDPA